MKEFIFSHILSVPATRGNIKFGVAENYKSYEEFAYNGNLIPISLGRRFDLFVIFGLITFAMYMTGNRDGMLYIASSFIMKTAVLLMFSHLVFGIHISLFTEQKMQAGLGWAIFGVFLEFLLIVSLLTIRSVDKEHFRAKQSEYFVGESVYVSGEVKEIIAKGDKYTLSDGTEITTKTSRIKGQVVEKEGHPFWILDCMYLGVRNTLHINWLPEINL